MAAITIAVTGAAGQIGYSLLPLIARGDMLGPQQHVILHLMDIEPALPAMKGLEAELMDCAYPLLDAVVTTADARVAFTNASIVILCGAYPRKAGMDRKELLAANAKIFRHQGAVLAEVASADCRVLVVGNPANTNALILLKAAHGKLNAAHVTALTRLDHNRALAAVAERAGVPASEVKNVVIWGNHSSTQVPDLNSAMIAQRRARDVIADNTFCDELLVKKVQERGAEIIRLRGLSSAMSAAKAVVDHVRDWMLGTPAGTFVSMAVYNADNAYNCGSDLIVSLPCTCRDGEWHVVPDLPMDTIVLDRVRTTLRELEAEKQDAGIA